MKETVNRLSIVAALTLALLFSIFTFNSSALLAAKERGPIKLSTKATDVTVYPGEALVTRKGTVTVPAGDFRIICDDLPDKFVEHSLHVSATGDIPASIFGVDIERCKPLSKRSGRYVELKKKLEKLQKEMDAVKSKLSALEKKKDVLTAMGEYSADNMHKQIAAQRINVENWQGVLDFFEGQYEGIEKENSKLNREKTKLENDITWVSSVIDSMNYSEKLCRNVIVNCSAEKSGTLTVEFSYLVDFASWASEYIVRLDREKNKVLVDYNARVSQSSGEDWEDVEMTLSTATPGVGASPPKIKPYYLSGISGRYPIRQSGVQQPEIVALKSGVVKVGNELHIKGGRSGRVSFGAQHQTLGATNTPFATNFIVPRPISLKSGGEKKRFLVKQSELEGEFSLYAVPSISKNVFIKSKIKNTTGMPLLAGPAEVYVLTGSGTRKVTNFVGKDLWESIAAGQKFDMFFGVDQDIKVKHKLVKKEILSKTGESKKKVRYDYLITIESFKKKDAEVTVKDRIPVSTNKDIKVSGVKIDPKPDLQEKNGIVTWNLKLTPKVRQEIRVTYKIEYPAEWYGVTGDF